MLNALKSGVIKKRVSEVDARAAMEDFLALPIPTVSGVTLFRNAFDIALTYDCAFYDALYIALADSEQCTLIHADGKLRNSLGGSFPHELWIEDYTAS